MKRLSLCIAVLFALGIVACVSAQNKNESTLPQIISMPAPDYPQAAKEAGIGGDVYVLLFISKKGQTKVVDAYGPMAPCTDLDDPLTASVQAAAVEAAKKATFVPATYNGKPAEKGFQLRYIFDPKKALALASAENIGSTHSDGEVVRPVPIHIPKAHYSERFFGELSGLVTVKMLIFEDGLVHYAGALSGHRDLRRAAVEAACGSTFQPATRDGKPIKFEFVIEHNFYNVYERG